MHSAEDSGEGHSGSDTAPTSSKDYLVNHKEITSFGVNQTMYRKTSNCQLRPFPDALRYSSNYTVSMQRIRDNRRAELLK